MWTSVKGMLRKKRMECSKKSYASPRMTTPRNQMQGNLWREIASAREFQELLRAKRRVIVPATLFFIIYYFALPVLVGYAPVLMERKVIGNINLAYVFALSQFLVAWGIAALYLRAASRFDAMAKDIVRKVQKP